MSYNPNDTECIVQMTVATGQTVTAQKIVEMAASGVQNATGSSLNVIGVAKTSGTSSEIVKVSYGREIDGFSGLTVGAYYYLANDGTLSATAGTITEKMALAVSATKIIWLDAAL